MAGSEISEAKLLKASWDGLRRLGRSLGLNVPDDEPEESRGSLMQAVMREIRQLTVHDIARRKRQRRHGAVAGYIVRDSRASQG